MKTKTRNSAKNKHYFHQVLNLDSNSNVSMVINVNEQKQEIAQNY